jgi:hypothetical protein
MNNFFYEIALIFRWPHEGLVFGYEFFNYEEEEPWYTLKLHLLLITIVAHFGDE